MSLRKRARACGTKMIVLYFHRFLLPGTAQASPAYACPSRFESLGRSRRPGSSCRRSYGPLPGLSTLLDRAGNRRRTERSKGQGFGQVRREDPFAFLEIGDRARDAEGAVDRAGREVQSLDRDFEDARAGARRAGRAAGAPARVRSPLRNPGVPPRRDAARARAFSTRPRIAEDGSPFAGPRSSVHARSRKTTWRSIRSSSGPDNLRA